MVRTAIILTFLFFVFSLSLSAQQHIFKIYTEEDGLVSNPVRRIFQDARGFIWIGTWQGLSKYDGHKFTNYTTVNGLSDNMINDMYESPDGKLYVAENSGITDILQHDAIVKKAAFRNVLINRFYTARDQIVIAATDTGGIYELKNETLVKPFQKFPHLTYNDLTELNDSLLIGGSEGPLRILNKQFEILSEIKLSKETVTFKIFKDSKNKLWAGTSSGLLLMSPTGKNNYPFNFTVSLSPFNIPVLKNHQVADMLEDSKGNLWVATTHGLVKIDTAGSWQLFVEKDGLPSSNIYCLFLDKEKNIWIGTSLGLAKLVMKSGIRIYPIEDKLSPGVGFISTVNKDIYLLGTYPRHTLFNKRNNHFTTLSLKNTGFTGLVKNSWPLLLFGDNNWLGKYDSINQKIEDYSLPELPNAGVTCSIMDTNGIVFNGTGLGLAIRLGGKFYYETKFPYRITDIIIDKKGFVWVGTWSDGLFRIHYTNTKNSSGNNRVNLFVEDFSHLLPEKNIRCLFADSNGNIWVGTRNHGIIQLINNSSDQYIAKGFDLRHGLMSNWARVIAEDSKGCVWIGSNLGIDKLIPAGNTFRVFNFSRVNNYFDHINEIKPDQDNSLWLATNKGLINIIDGESEKNPAPPVYITSVSLSDTNFNYTTYNPDKKVQLKYFQNEAKFEFSAPGFINEKQVLYSYRLLGGADTSWTKPANIQNVSYASLQPGNYRFEVRTTGWNGDWGLPESFSFIVRKPYWQTWWFYSLAGLVVILFFYGLYRYRIKQLLKLQKVRNRIASDLHDDIGATLTNINILSEISRKNLQHPAEAEKFLQRITEEVTFTSQALNDIIWSVNSRNDSMEEMVARMRRYAAELFDNSNTICHLSLDETVADKKLNMEQRRDFYLIYKEVMNNIHKHASAANISVNVLLQDGRLFMKINDDGNGFDFSVATNGNGLKNIRSRSEKWNGSTSVKSSMGNGTQIEIMIPLVN
jgi:ligand-binding sensor domain-containing protein/two-component sensor histidine kinase